ncbi:WD40-repeat-containing domain protein [Zychaea mexicana]|uniref:WD40-repeat-containing domain protein n=1 Tax=Zychaea mexicana TaxID=64656 RepID=UPI0022FEB784|nr:WD40-repeat-containing domain protein [Zychaea mexicana]KAI9492779.1 WD40-repeat-containing domain protein [Zychaea mexicana]
MVSVASEAGNFFQTDAEIKKQKEKEAKYNYTEGDALKLSTKALALLVTGKYAYVAESGFSAKRINLETNKTVKLFKGHKGPVSCIALSHDKQNVWTGSWDKTIKKWDAKTGECLATLQGHTDFVKSLLVVGEHIYSGSSDTTIRQWHMDTLECVTTLKKHSRAIECLAADSKFLYAGSSDRLVTKWDRATHECVATFDEHDTSVYCVRVWDDEMWTASADKTVRRWNTETGAVDTVLTHPDRVKSLVILGPYVITGSSDDAIRVWDIASGKQLSTIEGHFDEVGCLDVAGTTLYSASLDCSLRRWTITPSALKEYNEKPKKKPADEEDQGLGLTEEEERELAELMDD